MKKVLLTLTTITATALTVFAQGHVSFNNESTFNASDAITVSFANQGPSGGNAGDGIGGDKYAVQLVWAAGTGLNQSAFDAGKTLGVVVTGTGAQGAANNAFLANTGLLSTFAGFFDAGLIPNPVGTSMPGGGYTMQVWAWYNVGFNSFDAALAAGKNVGKSALFNVVATTGASPVNSTLFPGFTLLWIPEPSTLSLGMLGAAAMLIFRRKK